MKYLKNKLNYRDDFIKNYFLNKKVIHLGCCDHIPLISLKIENETWMHKIITDSSLECIGIDINKEAINYLEKNYDIKNIYYGDIVNDQLNLINDKKWDYLFMGEILEHIDNPHHFLSEIRNKYRDIISEIVITVPNALNFTNIRFAFRNHEIINSDHRFWFTPYTLAKLLTIAEYTDIKFSFIEPGNTNLHTFRYKINRFLSNPMYLIELILIRKLPMLRESLIMIAKL